ncbi:hypothetical protein WG908_15240 [Sphingobium sp. AN641]|uniref:hypothetical protein n=1 Tax=Sphingobium sp. AN641 TaxID=3133443 RepID=UPI0030BE99D4
MALDAVMKELNFDRYDRNARLRPALFTILPILVSVAIWYPKIWSLFGALASLLVTCGVTFLLAQLARQLGRRLEHRWTPAIGRAHTAKLLSHSDPTLPAATKSRYHAYLLSHGIVLPTIQQERRDPAKAQDQYLSAITWLLEHTRQNANKSLLLDENVAYGFRRNLRGLKSFALVILALALAANVALVWRGGWASPMLETGFMLGGGLALVTLIWIFCITRPFVEDASLAYAQRLLAQSDVTASAAATSRAQNR